MAQDYTNAMKMNKVNNKYENKFNKYKYNKKINKIYPAEVIEDNEIPYWPPRYK